MLSLLFRPPAWAWVATCLCQPCRRLLGRRLPCQRYDPRTPIGCLVSRAPKVTPVWRRRARVPPAVRRPIWLSADAGPMVGWRPDDRVVVAGGTPFRMPPAGVRQWWAPSMMRRTLPQAFGQRSVGSIRRSGVRSRAWVGRRCSSVWYAGAVKGIWTRLWIASCASQRIPSHDIR